jgi:ABC-type bacteriocin/lantibiotic exporter with double-glycine peptidase domain
VRSLGDDHPMGEEDFTCEPVDYSVPVTYVSQPTNMSCWAASLAMLTGKGSAQEVADATNLQHAMNDGASSDEFQQAVTALGLTLEGGACGYPNMFGGWLHQYGAIMVCKDINPGFHAVVISGIHGDGTIDGTWFDQNDPAAGVNTITYKDFVQQYEGGAAFTAYFAHR